MSTYTQLCVAALFQNLSSDEILIYLILRQAIIRLGDCL